MKKDLLVIKVGGNDLSQKGYIPALAVQIAQAQRTHHCVIVHGGGRAISELMQRLDVQPKFVNGQRVTDAAALEIAEMVLSGQVNKALVLALLQKGVDALGMSGIDRGLLQVEPWSGEMDRVGRIMHVRTEVLLELCANNVVPVISPISMGPEGKYNVNADHAAGAIAGAIGAAQVVFISNVQGVQVGQEWLGQVSEQDITALIRSGKIYGGMIPKVSAGLAALGHGALSARITNLEGLNNGKGTRIALEQGDHR